MTESEADVLRACQSLTARDLKVMASILPRVAAVATAELLRRAISEPERYIVETTEET